MVACKNPPLRVDDGIISGTDPLAVGSRLPCNSLALANRSLNSTALVAHLLDYLRYACANDTQLSPQSRPIGHWHSLRLIIDVNGHFIGEAAPRGNVLLV
jgi:hypothetical protein